EAGLLRGEVVRALRQAAEREASVAVGEHARILSGAADRDGSAAAGLRELDAPLRGRALRRGSAANRHDRAGDRLAAVGVDDLSDDRAGAVLLHGAHRDAALSWRLR